MILVCLSLMNKDIEYLFTYLLFIHISSFMSFSSQIFCPCFYGAVCLLLHFLLQPTPVVLLGKSHGQRSVVGYSPWGCKEWDTTEPLHFTHFQASLVAQLVKNLPAMQETWVQFLGRDDSLEKEMATHSSILAWKITWMEECGRLQSMGLQRVGHD